jgi:mitogen-activated protein kinase kinase kinase
MAPEVVKQTAYTSKADIWSLGCLVVEMLTGAHPWANLTQMQAIFRVRPRSPRFPRRSSSPVRFSQIGQSACPTIPDDISADADDFLEQTFLIDYEDRPAARDLLVHAFIRDPECFAASQQTPTRATFSQNNSPVKAEAV